MLEGVVSGNTNKNHRKILTSINAETMMKEHEPITVSCFYQHINIIITSLLDRVNSLPNDKILVWSKLKAFADDILNVTQLKKKSSLIG